jgi:hypothetical protein
MIHGMSVETARRYVKCVDEINVIVNKIHSLAYMIGVFSVVEHGVIDINPDVLGYLGQEIAHEVIRISEILDDHFVSRAEILLEL